MWPVNSEVNFREIEIVRRKWKLQELLLLESNDATRYIRAIHDVRTSLADFTDR